MKYILLSIILMLLVITCFNRKISVFKIMIKQMSVYRNDKAERTSWFNIFTFVISPAIISIILVFIIDVCFVKNLSESIITILSIVATILLSFLALLIDKKNTSSNEKVKQVSNETYITIIMTTLYSLMSILAMIVLSLLPEIVWLNQIFNAIIYFSILKIVLNILMILKRMFLLLEDDKKED